jgi:hypothetical protein
MSEVGEVQVTAAWGDALHMVFTLLKAERLQELRDKHVRRFDERGLHPISLEVGRIQALQELVPELREANFDFRELRRAAREAAREDFLTEQWADSEQAAA